MNERYYYCDEVLWDDNCQGLHSAQCRKKPVTVLRSLRNGRWRWGLCREHLEAVEGSNDE